MFSQTKRFTAFDATQADAPTLKDANLQDINHSVEDAQAARGPKKLNLSSLSESMQEEEKESPRVAAPRSLNPRPQGLRKEKQLRVPMRMPVTNRSCKYLGDRPVRSQKAAPHLNTLVSGNRHRGIQGGVRSAKPLQSSTQSTEMREAEGANEYIQGTPGTPVTSLGQNLGHLQLNGSSIRFLNDGTCYLHQAGNGTSTIEVDKALIELAKRCGVTQMPCEAKWGQFVLQTLVENIAQCITQWKAHWIIEGLEVELNMHSPLFVHAFDQQGHLKMRLPLDRTLCIKVIGTALKALATANKTSV